MAFAAWQMIVESRLAMVQIHDELASAQLHSATEETHGL